MTHELQSRLDALARTPLLLVASDFDGTLAPIVPEPAMAAASRDTLVALRALSQMVQTHVAVISGRALRDLAARTAEVEELHLVGSHGSEFEAGFAKPLPPGALELLERAKRFTADVAGRTPGSTVEEKPASLAFHYRNADEQLAANAVEAILQGPGAWPGVYVRQGKKVVELSVVQTNKGTGLSRLRLRLGATAVLFLGDDVTDEDAFETLVGPDVGIKVGSGDSHARYRAADTLEVARILARVAERRADWLTSSYAVPIEQHALLSDQRTVALVNPSARVVWLCLPRIDSPALFAELLGGPSAGFLEVRPVSAGKPVGQHYVGDTFILETRWPTVTVTDYLDCGGSRAFQRAGRTDLLRVIEGKGRVRVVFAPRLDFGRMETRLRVAPEGVAVEGAVDSLVLRAPGLKWQLIEEGRHQTAVAELDLGQTGTQVLELRGGTANLDPDPRPETVRRERTQRFWSGWAASLTLPAVAPELVRRSALVLKALCYGPSGAIAAAATTSLPEHAGGVRNWDYRFCWPRDAAMAAAALVKVGVTGSALKFLDWLLGILDRQEPGGLIRPVYSVSGGHLGPEGEVSELTGYRGSRPVRVGNLAAQQIQLDVFGPVADLVARLAECGEALSSEHWRMLEAMVTAVAARWGEPDHGIWEVRRPRQRHLHSQVMCWQTVDRALRVARYLGRSRPEWKTLRDTIAADALKRGWSEVRHAFAATQDGHEADAAGLCVGLSGLLPPDEPRVLATLEHVDHELHVGPTVYRYRYDDGLPGAEGGFHLCTSWLIEAYAQVGRRDAAHALFEQLASLAGPTGLLSEEYEPQKRLALGNFPQAYSHLGLINAAVALGK